MRRMSQLPNRGLIHWNLYLLLYRYLICLPTKAHVEILQNNRFLYFLLKTNCLIDYHLIKRYLRYTMEEPTSEQTIHKKKKGLTRKKKGSNTENKMGSKTDNRSVSYNLLVWKQSNMLIKLYALCNISFHWKCKCTSK